MTRNSSGGAVFVQPVGFSVEYFDPVARLLKAFVLTVFPDGKLQMVSSNTGKMFLSKTFAKDLAPEDLFVGGSVLVFSRELKIVDYADASTRKYFESFQTRGFVMVFSSALGSLGEIIAAVQNECGEKGEERRGRGRPAVIANAKMFRLDGRRHRLNLAAFEDALPQNGSMAALEVITDSRSGGFASLLVVVDRLRQRHGGCVFASETPAEAAEHARYVFQEGEGGMSPAARIGGSEAAGRDAQDEKGCTLCIVKPHVVREGGLGAVLSFVAQRGFQVVGLQMMWFGEAGAEELLLPYRAVISYHAAAVRELRSGACVALQIEGGGSVVEEFREACGPADPEVARALYPNSVRALLGLHQATNAVHCTDLPEDGLLECQYVFGVLARGLPRGG